VGLLQSPNLMIIALFLKYQTDSPRSGLESGIQIYLLGSHRLAENRCGNLTNSKKIQIVVSVQDYHISKITFFRRAI
jgi:hypothetical protein